MTTTEFLKRSATDLEAFGVESGKLQSELLMAHVLKVPRLNLFLDPSRVLTKDELRAVSKLIDRRGNREPLQHIIGTTSFCGLEIKVNSHVLIPRPETESLAELAWRFLSKKPSLADTPISALDFGTGSGCLSLAIAVRVRNLSIWALESSPEALAVARENGDVHKTPTPVQWIHGDGFSSLPAGLQFDLIVSNPPYIPSDEIPYLSPEVRDYDPRIALDGGTDGLKFFRLLAENAGPFLRSSGRIMVEIGDGQSNSICKIFEGHGWAVDSMQKDLSGTPRFLIAHLPDSLKDIP